MWHGVWVGLECVARAWVRLGGVTQGVGWRAWHRCGGGWRAWHGVWVRLEGVAQGVGWT